MRGYSEFYRRQPMFIKKCKDTFCSHCGMTDRYIRDFKDAKQEQDCSCCCESTARSFMGLEALKRDIALIEGEKVGVTTSGGKDSIHALALMTDVFGKDRVVALTHHKIGLTDPRAEKNLDTAVRILGVDLIRVEESAMLERFRKNLALLIKKPDPALVRVVLCAGCRYGITQELYEAGVKRSITKYVSAASYLELAPFKEELLKKCGADTDDGFEAMLRQHREYNYDNNLDIIRRDNGYKYKSNRRDDRGGLKDRLKAYKLFDLDNYVENDPEQVEKEVTRRFGWQRAERSWHFDEWSAHTSHFSRE